jgi:alkane 1-monooxygenase
LEATRLRRRGHRVISWRNEILQAWTMTVALFGAVTALFGIGILPYLFLQAAVAIFILETVNYIEHYGLRRATRDDGRYEAIRPEHSWNSDQRVSNLLMFQLQRHSDHHAHPGRRYQTLRTLDEAPKLPAGYASMMLLAMSPLWMHVMGPRLVKFYDGDVTRANISPRRRTKILTRFGTPASADLGEGVRSAQAG